MRIKTETDQQVEQLAPGALETRPGIDQRIVEINQNEAYV
jgi:hypothetical protein